MFIHGNLFKDKKSVMNASLGDFLSRPGFHFLSIQHVSDVIIYLFLFSFLLDPVRCSVVRNVLSSENIPFIIIIVFPFVTSISLFFFCKIVSRYLIDSFDSFQEHYFLLQDFPFSLVTIHLDSYVKQS